MIVLLVVSLIAIFLTYLDSRGNLKNGMGWGFVIITIIQAIHYDFGNDYMSYYNVYNEITSHPFNLEEIFSKEIWKEPGWAIINYLFENFGGFFCLVAVLSIIQNFIYYNFIRKYVNHHWWVLALFIYLFSTSYYVMNMSMLRQGFAISLFLCSFSFFRSKRLLPALILIFIAASVHNSAKILYPFIFLGFLPMNKISGKVIASLSLILFLFLFFSGEFLNTVFESLMDREEFQEYGDTYGNDTHTVSFGIGFIMNLIPFIVMLWYLSKNKNISVLHKQILFLAIIGTLIVPFAQILPLITRVGMYFGVFTLAAIPLTYRKILNNIMRNAVLGIFVLMTLYNYYIFSTSEVFSKAYSTYHTIFSVI